MSKLLVDVEQGAAALFRDLTEPPTDGSQLPAEAAGVVSAFADQLGLDKAKLGPVEAGHLFDLVNHAVEALSANTGGGAEPDAAMEAGKSTAAAPGAQVQEPPAEIAPPSNERQGGAAESQQVPPLNAGGAPEHGPADLDLPPVTAPQEGFEICPKCSGFRTVLEGGTVTPCPECRGAGEVPVKAAPVA